MKRLANRSFTLIEMMLGASIMVVVIVALMGAFFGQGFLGATARNLNLAMNDATRVVEQIRQQNSTGGCPNGYPSAIPPLPSASWNAWLNAQGKSIRQGRNDAAASATDNSFELVAVTCQDQDGGNQPTDYCGPTQVGAQEWKIGPAANPTFDPIRITVAVGWRQSQRGIGQDFRYTPAGQTVQGKVVVNTPESFTWADTDGDGVIESRAMITTLVTCL